MVRKTGTDVFVVRMDVRIVASVAKSLCKRGFRIKTRSALFRIIMDEYVKFAVSEFGETVVDTIEEAQQILEELELTTANTQSISQRIFSADTTPLQVDDMLVNEAIEAFNLDYLGFKPEKETTKQHNNAE